MRDRILLVTPPYHSGVVETAGRWPHAGFVYLAGALRASDYDPIIYDAMARMDDYAAIEREIRRIQPDVVATSTFTASVPESIALLRMAKRLDPDVVTVMGGVHPTFMYEEMLSQFPGTVDYVVRGEGDLTLPELMDAINGKRRLSEVLGIAYRDGEQVVATADRPMMADLDLFTPAWDLLRWTDYVFYPLPESSLAVVSTSRGCNQACSFCSQQKFWRRSWRGRDPDKVIDELALLKHRFGVEVVMFADETPTLDPVRWERLLDGLIERHLGMHILMETRVDDIVRDAKIMHRYAEAGVGHIYVGVEATSQETLDRFNKNLAVEKSKQAIDLIKANGMIAETSFVLGMPDETTASIKRTLELAKHYDPDLAFFLAIAPWPYADIYPELEPYVESRDYADYNLVAPVIKPVAMSTQELTDEIMNCYRSFYMDKLDHIDEMPPEKREYLLVTMKLLMENSYLKQWISGFGKMPEVVREKLTRSGLKVRV